MGTKSALGQGVEPSSLDIRFKLPVPNRGVEIRKPLAEPGELFWRELLDLSFNGFYWAHRRSNNGVQVILPRSPGLG